MTTTTATMTDIKTTTIMLNAQDLFRVLSNTALASSADTSALCAVKLEVQGSTLKAVATDRYRLHTDTAPLVGADESVEASTLIRRADVLAIVKQLKSETGQVLVTFSPSSIAVAARVATLTFETLDATFPSWQSLMPAADGPTELDAPLGFNPALMADFSKVLVQQGSKLVKSKTTTIRTNGARKPMRVEIGETFVGLLMPVRPSD